MLTVSARTDAGSVRTINEDAFMWDPDLGLVAVADGMGGHNAGEVAARLALETIRAFLRQSASGEDFTWPFGVDAKMSFAANRLQTALKIANRRVHRASEERAEYTGMGTTVVAAIAAGSRLTFASVGDSRMYVLNDSGLEQLTTDDTWVALLSKESGQDPSVFGNHPMRNVLTSVIGARAEIELAAREIDLVDGQAFLLSSDGLHGALTEAAMVEILRAAPDLDGAASRLVDAAVKQDGSDNVTALVARYNASR